MLQLAEDSVEKLLTKTPCLDLVELPDHLVQPLLQGILELVEDVRTCTQEKSVVRQRLYLIIDRFESDLPDGSKLLESWPVIRARLFQAVFGNQK
jgi:hypothetical protein